MAFDRPYSIPVLMILAIGRKLPFIIYIFCLFAHIRIYKLDEFDEVLSAIEAACQQQNIPTTSMTSEYGTGQFEVNLQHQDDVLQAADHAVLLGRAIQGVSRSLGYDATFMSKPFSGQTGNGMQVGIAESMAIFAPNINAYRRFKADEFVPVTRD